MPRPMSLRAGHTVRRLCSLLVLTLVVMGLTASPAQAATTKSTTTRTTTRSCVDGGGITWHTKVVWGITYKLGSVTKVSVPHAGWTSTLGSIATDSSVKTYDGSGRLAATLLKTATVDYQQGSVSDARNAFDPRSGGARIVIKVGRDADGFADCTVTHPESATAAPVVATVGDMVCPPGFVVTTSTCRHKAVSNSILAANPAAFLTLGDNQYGEGTPAQFRGAYEPSYGRFRGITSPTVGNHEYRTPGAAGYFGYFGTAAGDPLKGYYAQDIGSWRVIALNSEVDITATGAQLAWLKNDLAAHKNVCTLVFMHKARFSSGSHGNYTSMRPIFDALVAARVELLLSGHDHNYERFIPQTGSGSRSSLGVTQVVVGTGGKSLNGWTTATKNSVVRSQAGHGWLKLTLNPTSAELRYVGLSDNPFADYKNIACR